MFDFGLSELLLTGVIALIVLGPERLPKAARTAGRMVGKIQRLVANVRQELSVQVELEELRKAKEEFETAANELRNEMKEVGRDAHNSLNHISDGLKPWERLPEQRTPADFGVGVPANPSDFSESISGEAPLILDENGQPIAPAGTPAADSSQAWRDYLHHTARPSETPAAACVETLPAPVISGLHTASLRKQAMQRKRGMRPKFQAKPKLRVRKK